MMAKLVTLIETAERRGKGVEDDPVRLVSQWFTLEGEFVAERDPWLESAAVREIDRKTDGFISWAKHGQAEPVNPRDTLNTIAKP